MRLLVSAALVFLLIAGFCRAPATARGDGIAPKHHPWGAFPEKAWKTVRVVTETFDENGKVASTTITETETTLEKVDEDGVVLTAQVAVEVAGRRFEAEPQTVKQGFHGELLGKGLTVKQLGAGQVVVEGRKIDCKIVQLVLSGPTSKTVTNIYYSPETEPHVLRRTSVTTDLEGENTLSKMSLDVLALDMPYRVLAEIQSTALIRTVQEHAKGTITTWSYSSSNVPGGVVCHSSKEVDKNGRLIRRSTLQLTGYGSEPENGRVGLFGRKRALRDRRSKTPSRF